jgi:hypothetical protein
LGGKGVNDDDGNIVAAPSLFRGTDEGGGGGFAGPNRFQVGGDQVIRELFGETIATHQQTVAGVDLDRLYVNLSEVFSA